MRNFCGLVFFIFLFQSLAQSQEVPPSWEFVTLKSAHFDVIVNARQQDLGVLYAEKLETAYEFLLPFFSERPERTVVVISDKTDVTNGYATRLPYPHIVAYPVLPGPMESLSESGDWALELLVHEYTHVLNFEPAGSFFKYLRGVFGSIVAPNLLLPRWWKEGLAVHIESQIGGYGRLRSVYQEGVLRTLAKANRLHEFDIAEINEILPSWPEGHRPYLFGSLLWADMTAQKGPGLIDQLNQHHGRRMPYLINTPPEIQLGKDYPTLYEEMLTKLDASLKEQIKTLERTPMTPLQYLNLKTQYLSYPSISPDGKFMAVVSVDETDKREIKLLHRQSQKSFLSAQPFKKVGAIVDEQQPPQPQDGPPSGSIQRVSWFHQSAKIIFDKTDSTNRLERYSDLHVFDLNSQKSIQVTRGLRGREPSVAPNDKDVVFVQLDGGKTSLSVINLDSKKTNLVWAAPIQQRISYPVFIDDQRIIFALRKEDGDEGLWLIDRNTQQMNRILAAYKDARFPLWNGRELYFSSSRNGVFNLYKAENDFQNAKPMTHVLGSVFASAWDPQLKELYVSSMTDHGPQVARVPTGTDISGNLPKVEGLFAQQYPRNPTLPQKKNVVESSEEYSSLTKLWPHYWIPWIYTSTVDNSVGFQASTSGHDPLKRHEYSLTGVYETGVKKGSALGSYRNNQTLWPIVLQSSEVNKYLYKVENLVTTTSSSLSVWPDVFSLNRYTLWELGGKYQKTVFSSSDAVRNGVFTRLIYSDFTRAGTQISPESGYSGYLGALHNYYNTDQLTHTQYTFGGTAYFSKWLPARHAMMLKINGFHVDEALATVWGASNTSMMPIQDTSLPTYVMRGYTTGQFVGRKLYNLNFEYRFPFRDLYEGWDTKPWFLQRLHGAFVTDGVMLDGLAYNKNQEGFERVTTARGFWSSGLEARMEITLGYVLPLNLLMGWYAVHDVNYGLSGSLGFGIQSSTVF